MSENEIRLSTALSTLRKVTGPTTDENAGRVDDYLEALETEIDRIKDERGRARAAGTVRTYNAPVTIEGDLNIT